MAVEEEENRRRAMGTTAGGKACRPNSGVRVSDGASQRAGSDVSRLDNNGKGTAPLVFEIMRRQRRSLWKVAGVWMWDLGKRKSLARETMRFGEGRGRVGSDKAGSGITWISRGVIIFCEDSTSTITIHPHLARIVIHY